MEMTRKPTHPGKVFSEEVLKATGVSTKDAAKALGIDPMHLVAICSGCAQVTQDIAEKFAAYTDTTAESWTQMQVNFDEWLAR